MRELGVDGSELFYKDTRKEAGSKLAVLLQDREGARSPCAAFAARACGRGDRVNPKHPAGPPMTLGNLRALGPLPMGPNRRAQERERA
jgi:hypothetical protein